MHLIQEKWTDILNMIKTEHQLSDVSFNTWLKSLTVHKVEGDTVTIIVPTGQIGINYIANKYLLPLKVAISETAGEDYEIALILPDDVPPDAVDNPVSSAAVNESIEKANLNPKYTFDTFVVGSNNKLAHAASVAVAESPGEVYNPLFIYGGVGLGKTHLMHSIAHFVLQKRPQSKVLYVTSEYFTNELIESIRNGNNSTMSKFREKYRNIDVLLIDDIQFIIGKESTQEEFFHTFNALHGAKKQIIISSDKPPKDMEILEDRLRSRFEWGLIVDISSPDFETRMAILRKKEELDGYQIDDQVIEYIAQNVKSNIRELEGSLNKIMAYANLENREINLALAEKVLKDIISPNQKRTVTPELIINIVAEHFDLTPSDLTGNKRSSKIAFPRQIVMYLCRQMTETTLKIIGDSLGGRDHTTIMSGINKIEREVEENDDTREIIDILKKKINPAK